MVSGNLLEAMVGPGKVSVGEAKGAKAQQKAALQALNEWVHRFNGIVVPTLSDRPDLLSMLGWA